DRALGESLPKTTVEAEVPEATQGSSGPKPPAEQSSSTPSTMELLGILATGMKQLQDAQLRQLEKKSDVPEVVKPGISSLPSLSQPGQDTSPVDIQDWLEEAGSVMTDLSDSSWEWWLQVKDYAEEHYRKWVKSTPLEKISLAMPKNASLEQGRYGRVNARAAGMVLAALTPEVKSEMITKKVTGSTLSLIFKLLTVYRPGGEKEKTLLLQQLTSPEVANTAEEAVRGVRRWGRWHARAKDLTVAVPDPVLMIKGLSYIVSGVLSRHQDVWLREERYNYRPERLVDSGLFLCDCETQGRRAEFLLLYHAGYQIAYHGARKYFLGTNDKARLELQLMAAMKVPPQGHQGKSRSKRS
ncbi:TY5A, partial [Symbiodinium necroappetens]